MKKPVVLLLAVVLVSAVFAGAAFGAVTAGPRGSDTFADVPAGSWFDEPVGWAFANGVTTGTSDTTFDPHSTLTRAQFVTFLHRYHKQFGADGALPSAPASSTTVRPVTALPVLGSIRLWDTVEYPSGERIAFLTGVAATDDKWGTKTPLLLLRSGPYGCSFVFSPSGPLRTDHLGALVVWEVAEPPGLQVSERWSYYSDTNGQHVTAPTYSDLLPVLRATPAQRPNAIAITVTDPAGTPRAAAFTLHPLAAVLDWLGCAA